MKRRPEKTIMTYYVADNMTGEVIIGGLSFYFANLLVLNGGKEADGVMYRFGVYAE